MTSIGPAEWIAATRLESGHWNGVGTNNRVTLGNATGTDTATTLLVLDSATADPTTSVSNGSSYYNSSTNKFRCYQNSGWTDCVSAGTVTNLQTAYNGSTSPEITVDGTRGAVTIQDASSPIGANLFEVTSNGGGTVYLAADTTGTKTTNLHLSPTGNSSSTITKSTVVTGTVAANDILVLGSNCRTGKKSHRLRRYWRLWY